MMSLFGDLPGKPSAGPTITRVPAKKPPPPPRPSTVSINGSSGSSSSSSSSHIKTSNNGNSLKPPRGSPSAKIIGMSKTKSKSPLGNGSTPSRPSLQNKSAGSSSSIIRKRRTPSPIRSEDSSSSDNEEESDDDNTDSTRGPKQKKRKVNGNNGIDSLLNGITGGSQDVREEKKKDMFCLDKVDERGEYERGWTGFVSSLEAMKGDIKGWKGGKGDGRLNLEKYVAYFPQEGFENAEPLPSVELLYPGGCRETFILLAPTSAREYSPISELRNVLRIILDHYIPPSHSHIFGTLSATASLDANTSSLPSRVASPLPTSSSTQNGTPPPQSNTNGPTSHTSNTTSPAPQLPMLETIGDALRKALAPNRRDGPALKLALEKFNSAFAEILSDGTVEKYLKGRNKEGMDIKEWSRIVEVVHDQAYSRVVGPYSNELEHHPKHPEEVMRALSGKEDAYGELRHNFMSKIIEQTKLGPNSTFVDLGSGVGNCVLQVGLQAGSMGLGIELLPIPAHCARLQRAEVQRRWAMWGLNGNLEVRFEEGDFRGNSEVAKWLKDADVVLVNNEVFPPSLNVDLTNMFLDLKDGAIIISLKPFIPENWKINPSNCDSFAAIVKISGHRYFNDWVSWKGDSGKYYLQVIDRSMRRGYEEELNGRRKR